MTEELKIKLSVDTTALKASVDQAKHSINSITSDSGKGAKKGSKEVNSAMVDLKGTMESIKHLQFWDLMTKGMDKAKANFSNFTAEFKDFSDHIRNAAGFATGKGKFMKLNGFSKDIKSAKIEAHEALYSLQGGFKSLGASISAFAKSAAAAIGVVVGMVIVFVGAIKNAVKVSKQMAIISTEARKIGMSVNSYQKWGYIMQHVGGDVQDLTDFIKTLSSEQVKAREGNEDTIKSFEKLGISAEALQNMNQQQLFEETVRGLQNVENQVERTALAYKIFGEEDAANLTNLLAMNNQQLEILAKNYQYLGGYATPELTQSSLELQASVGNLKMAWQGIKNVLAESVLPAIIAVVNWFVKAIAIVRMFFATIFNVGTGSAAATGKATQSMNKYAGAIGAAGGAAAKLKRAIMGFDELNVLPDNSTSGGGGGGGFSGGGFEAPDIEGMIPTVEDLGLEEIAKWFEDHKHIIEDWTTGILTIGGLVGGIALLVTGNIPAGLALIGAGILGIITGLGDDGTWVRLWESIKSGALACWEAIKGFFAPAVEWVSTNIFQPIGEFFSNAVTWIDENFIQPVINFFKPVVDAARECFHNIGVKAREIIDGIKTAFWSIVDKVREIYNTIKQIFLAIGRAIYDYVIKPVIDWVSKAANWIYQKAILPVINFFKELGRKAYDHIIKPIYDKVVWLRDKVVGIFKAIGTTVADFIGGAIRGIVNSVLSKIENTINGFIGMLNGAVGIINKIPGVNISYVSKLSIPRLATGGITNGSTIANIGENGREAVLPLENNTGWMDMLADKISKKQNTAPSKIILTLDGRELGWASINNINAITRQTGGLQLVL